MAHSFNALADLLKLYLDAREIDLIQEAYVFAVRAHQGQLRRTGDAYICHPLAVSEILAHMHMDYESIIAALLHDVLEDTLIDKADLEARYGETVATLVDGVSKLKQIQFNNQAEAQAENLRKMMLAMVRDIRVIIIKMADRLHNMRTLGALAAEKRRRIALETLEIYAPIANRLGMRVFKIEFEELGFSYLYPMRARVLREMMIKMRGVRAQTLQMIQNAIQEKLTQRQLGDAVVTGREKNLYSIYRKMKSKRLSFHDIMDVYGFRIELNTVAACYQALGLLHNLYKPIQGRFKDYIAIPKLNGYQSLHTTLVGPEGLPLEVQIRTHDMHRLSETGVAAHWLYKLPEITVTAQGRAREWFAALLEMQKKAGDSMEFMENVKIDLFPEELYVFTPAGHVIKLPAGATVVDFAYTVHTDIGNMCVAAKINRRLAPLSTVLLNGQTVEIITATGAKPNPAWLSFVVTSKARSHIGHFLKSQRRADTHSLGEAWIKTALRSHNIELSTLPPEVLDRLLKECHLSSLDALFEDAGLGNRTAYLIAERLAALLKSTGETDGGAGEARALSKPLAPLLIKGTEGMAVSFADCCFPIPGDCIMGFSTGQGILVHQEECQTIAKRQTHASFIPLVWAEEIARSFPVHIEVQMKNQRGMLAQLALAISEAKANIEKIVSEDPGADYSWIRMLLGVYDRAHLEKVLQRIRLIKEVTQVSRT
jgi:RelA/SpoT family (p)ppGpp synthetase